MSTEIQSNEVLEKVFNEATQNRSLNRMSVQRELLEVCEDESEKRDLLVYLARIKQVHVADIICDIKNVDQSLAMSLRHEETARWKKSQLPLPTSLLPVFSTA
jgi:hypothetical protein